MSSTPLTIKEKISYGLGDTGCNLVWQTVMLFLAYFYTDIFGLSPAHMGTMFLAVRIIDAITDVLMGAIADRTKTRMGQFRPYILWFAIPFGCICTLTFYTPELSYTGKLIYAYASYILLSLVYTAINVPYCAMINNISHDSQERVSLQSYRFALSTAGGLIVSIAALPLVKYLGKGNPQHGYFYTMMLMSVISIILFFICFSFTKEKYSNKNQAKDSSLATDLKILTASKEWRILFVLNIVNLIAVLLKNSTAIYYVNNVMGKPDLASTLLTTSLIAGIIGALLSARIFKNIDKVKGFKFSMFIEAILLGIFYFIPASNIYLVFAFIIAINFIQLAATPLQWSMLSDVVDDIEKKTGQYLSGIVFSTNLFAIKLGIAIGGALVGYLLSWSHYVGGATAQTSSALAMINALFTVIPGVLVFSLILIMHRYSLDDAHISAAKLPSLAKEKAQ
ncbi:glycoside-pentoside-hexuronide (GPH):cation symporter [Celerinatantimonas sp. YJH-8]|uniref:glycoside-pentoside-hexuronide (GPH):cation symporter n=1 Tax=Celerinatantimonas sp. YJH-8 TaxID=3228714 RepID=UPI0038C5B1CF